MSKVSVFEVLSEMANSNGQVFAFSLSDNLKRANTGRDGWGEITIAVPNNIIMNLEEYSGSLFIANAVAYENTEQKIAVGKRQKGE